MEAGKKHTNVCNSHGLAPATVSAIMVNAENIKQSAQELQNCEHQMRVTLEILT
jgi:hypothetical protein